LNHRPQTAYPSIFTPETNDAKTDPKKSTSLRSDRHHANWVIAMPRFE
jgi:hypothetical protein